MMKFLKNGNMIFTQTRSISKSHYSAILKEIIEIYRNRCINNIGRLNKLDRKRLRIPDNIYIEAKERMFNTYFELQDYNSSERQTKDNKKEIPIDTILDIIDNPEPKIIPYSK